MELRRAFIAWTPPYENLPTAGMVKIREIHEGLIPVWSDVFLCTGGAADMRWRSLSAKRGLQRLLHEMKAMVRIWKMHPRVVHDACLEIEEYAQAPKFHLYKYRASVD